MAKAPKGYTAHVGKGSRQERMENRFARTSLHGGDPMARALGDYAKGTPLRADGAEADPVSSGFGPSIGRRP